MKRLKIGMDISQIAHGGGVAVYTQELAERLSRVDNLDMVFFYSSLRKSYRGNLKNIKKYKLPPTLFEILFNKVRTTPIESFIGQIDIFHSSDWIQPPTNAKKITTYHDVVPLKFPQWSHPKIVEVNRRRLKIVEKEIDCVIAVSESTKKDLLELSSIPESKIKVVYEAVDEQFKPQSEEAIIDFKKKFNLPDIFVLAIGGIGERKNIKRVKEVCKEYNLVITKETIPELDYEELPLLYSSAKTLLYPSLYEGFGLPILEAMACGTPVITSNTSSMPEVAGDAALLVDPEDERDILEKLDLIMNDKKLIESFIKKGLKRSKEFNWEKAVSKTVEIYKDLIDKHEPH